MNPERDREFDQNMNQLIWLLKKILKTIPTHPQGDFPHFASPSKDGNIQLNLCFFTFLPIGPEDMDELEEIYDQYFFQDEKGEDLSGELNAADRDFLRRNGIRF